MRAMHAGKRQIVGYGILLAAAALFFWWGFLFDTWGRRFSLDPAFLGFVGWFGVGAFGAGYANGGYRTGLKWGGIVLAVLAAAFGVGVLTGNYS